MFTCTSVSPVVALTSGGNGDVEAGAEGRSFSDDPAWRGCPLWLLSIFTSDKLVRFVDNKNLLSSLQNDSAHHHFLHNLDCHAFLQWWSLFLGRLNSSIFLCGGKKKKMVPKWRIATFSFSSFFLCFNEAWSFYFWWCSKYGNPPLLCLHFFFSWSQYREYFQLLLFRSSFLIWPKTSLWTASHFTGTEDSCKISEDWFEKN